MVEWAALATAFSGVPPKAAKSLVQYNILKPGGVAEWLKARLSKSRILARESKVQILSPPPIYLIDSIVYNVIIKNKKIQLITF